MKPSISKIVAAVERDNHEGFCIACGHQTTGVEPDARNYPCEACEKDRVFGASELLFMSYA